jgi:hypothetical protein
MVTHACDPELEVSSGKGSSKTVSQKQNKKQKRTMGVAQVVGSSILSTAKKKKVYVYIL